MRKKTILVYGIPAYGHLWSNLYLAEQLTKEGFRVVYYSTEHFREIVEANGCIFRTYPVRQEELDLTDGQRILKLYRLILQHTLDMLPQLLQEAKLENPCIIMFDSLALWGRAVSQYLHVPAVSFYSIVAINPQVKESFFAYAKGFMSDFYKYARELPQARRIRKQLSHRYQIKHLGMLPVLMNQGDYDLLGYSRAFQPAGRRFGNRYLFTGPLSIYRNDTSTNDFVCPKGLLIYISLGTIFHQNQSLYQLFIKAFGNTKATVVMVYKAESQNKETQKYPKNFIVRPFVNQQEILQKASLFITAGGLNSIHEALYYGVPCLMCPQQGEQLINARQFEKLGFGKILRKHNPDTLFEQAKKTIKLKSHWDEELRKQMTMIHLNGALMLLRNLYSDEIT